MNYRHEYHAGNFADVMKHVLLLRLFRAMQRKEAGFLFVETHAGRGSYDFARAATGDTLPRTPEWPEGVGRLWTRTDLPEGVAEYLALVRLHDRRTGNLTEGLRFYPGSPWLACEAARPQDRQAFWERHPAECAALREALAGRRRVAIQEADGYGAFRACLPPPERRALALIDPPFEETDEWERIVGAAAEGLRRLPGCVIAVWYPLTARARPDEAGDAFARLGKSVLATELVIDPAAAKMTGCGLLVVNAPWQFDREAEGILDYLGATMGREGQAGGSVRWLKKE